MTRSGQIAMQYADSNGVVSGEAGVNPNGSLQNVEAITSPDGRIFGRMGHPERAGEHLYKNAGGVFDFSIFSSGVKYFS
jgi:phosphoribosylformylglycinamidine synthase